MKRLVLYVSGFDPRGSAHYYRLYREEARRQAEVSGHTIGVGPLQRGDALADRWDVKATIEGASCETRYEFLRWDDLVRKHWPAGHASYVWATVVTTLRLFVNGVLWRFLKTSLPGFQACVGAFVVVAFNALLAMLVLGIAGTAVAQSGFGFASGIAVALAVAALYGIYRFSRFTEEKWFMGWLMRGYAFTWKQAHSRLPDLEERLDRMADHLLASLRDASFEEVIVVGHSTGTMMAASVVGRAAQRVPEAIADPRLALLTLGECIPILSYQPAARAFRAQMCAAVSALGERWLDFTAPVDRCCAALVDPLDAARAIDGVRCASPKILSPQYAKLFTPERYAALRRNLFEMHFQYVKAGELPGTYDYFAITAGPRTLPARFAEQASVTGWKDLQVLGGPFPALARERA